MPASPTVVPASNLRPTREGQLCPPNRSYMMPTSGQPAPSFPTPITSSQSTPEVLSLPAIESLQTQVRVADCLAIACSELKRDPGAGAGLLQLWKSEHQAKPFLLLLLLPALSPRGMQFLSACDKPHFSLSRRGT